MPTVPESTWNQIGVVIVFAFLLSGVGWVIVKVLIGSITQMNVDHSKAVSEINNHYSVLIKEVNAQWQLYFDARSRNTEIIDGQIVTQLQNLTDAIKQMSERHDAHDTMVRNALDSMADKRKLLSKKQ